RIPLPLRRLGAARGRKSRLRQILSVRQHGLPAGSRRRFRGLPRSLGFAGLGGQTALPPHPSRLGGRAQCPHCARLPAASVAGNGAGNLSARPSAACTGLTAMTEPLVELIVPVFNE